MGCNGGYFSASFKYMKAYLVQDEASYPYVAYKNAACSYNSVKGVSKITNYVNVAAGNVTAHLLAVAQQPIAVAV
jgi:hypothetical protein